jgi:hypothetical protein
MTRPVRVAVVMVTLVIIALTMPILRAQAPARGKIDSKVTDPQLAIKAAAAAFKQAKPIDNYAPAKTAWGDPDISGTYLVATYTPLQRPERLKDKPSFTEDEAISELARVIGQDAEVDPRNVHYDWKEYGMDGWQSPIRPSLRTSLIVDPPDGRIPPLSPEGQKRRADRAAALRARAPEVSVRTLASTYTRCITGNAAGGPLVRGGNPDPANTTGSEAGVTAEIELLQSPGYAAIITQSNSDVRIIPLDERPMPPSNVRTWLGISRGHWEGNTLVVVTTNFNDKTPATNFQGSTENLKMTERFTLVNPTTIKYQYTLEDPHTWTRPWSVESFIPRVPPGIFEFACHESNYGVMNVVKGAQIREDEAVKNGKPLGSILNGAGAQ